MSPSIGIDRADLRAKLKSKDPASVTHEIVKPIKGNSSSVDIRDWFAAVVFAAPQRAIRK
jgi:hypothetical protein